MTEEILTGIGGKESDVEGNNSDLPQRENAQASVLVVDDEIELTNVLARGLTRAGHNVSVAHSAEDALERLGAGAFDLLLSDIHMPGMHGDELQRIARQRDPALAVILITAAQDTNVAVQCMREGIFDYIVKPAPLADISVRVQKALERSRLLKENQDYHVHLEERVAEQSNRIRQMLLKSMETLSHALEAKDENTRNHSVRVAELVAALASRLAPGDEPFRMRLRLAALLHDIGKMGVPEVILNKPGSLSPDEFAQVQQHPVIGETILRPMLGDEEDIMAVVRNHHERWDGKGYPDGLAGEETSFGARIAAVADAYDAMTSHRPYRAGMLPEKALQVLQEGAGTQWDPQIVAAAADLAAAGKFGQRSSAAPLVPSVPAREEETPVQPMSAPGARETARPVVIFVQNYLFGKEAERLHVKAQALLSRGRTHFELDMQGVQAVDQAAVHLLQKMHRMAEAAGGQMVIRNASVQASAGFYKAGVAEMLYFVPPLRPSTKS